LEFLEPEENESVARDFLERHADYKLESQRQLLPFADGVDGAYVARMRKSG
jgi:16S rRNA C967 or C1407 C5-methylase (RsmB/RsmF family)